jgi:exopolysaccharide biosynthesis protein
MKKIFITLACLFAVTASWGQDPDSVAFVNADWQITKLEKGAQAMYAQIPMFNSVQSICVIKYPAKKFRTEILHRPGEQSDIPSKLGKELGAAFALNAGYFNMKDLTPTVYFRIGDEIHGRTHATETYRVDGVIGIKNKKGTKFLIAQSDTTQYDQVAGKCHTVMATGPTLIIEDEIIVPVIMGNKADGANVAAMQAEQNSKVKRPTQHYSSAKFYDRRHPRTAFGTDEKGYVYLVVIDGRFKEQGEGATIWETARICQLLGMDNATNLDGGGSTTIWSNETGVINHPYDNRKFDHEGERKIPNLILVH